MDKNYLLLNNKVNMKDKEGNYINLNLEEKSVIIELIFLP